MSKTIKQNLFRFVTLRNPQLIENKENHKGFVFNPYEEDSVFFTAIDRVSEDEKQSKLKDTARGFSAMKTRKDARVYNEGLYQFSAWLMRNKNHLSFSEIKDNIGEAVSFDSKAKEDSVLWENLIYQTITQESVYVREAIIQMLIANEFLKAFNTFRAPLHADVIFTEDQEQDFVRRANASVVLSKALFSEAKIEKKKQKLSKRQEKQIRKEFKFEAAKKRLEDYKALVKELKKVEVKYNKDNQKDYKAALNSHNEVVERLIEAAVPVIVDETNPETGKIRAITTYPDLKLPKFEFTSQPVINKEYLASRISESALEAFNGQGLEVYDTFSEVYTAVNTTIQEEQQTVINNSPSQATTVAVGGSAVTINPSVVTLEPYCFRGTIYEKANRKANILIKLGTGYENSQITEANYTLTSSLGATYSNTVTQHLTSGNTGLKAIFFPEGLLLLNGTYSFSGEITLNNGVSLSFNVSNIQINRIEGALLTDFSGCCEASGVSNTDDSDENRIYGVTNLGIADFRRVEQEVCCYVPGEVSHIENVMAREYKERATRSLTSVEITTETTKESEVENLTDTTTTERNEMQSEVSAVINEDNSQNYGASASASYDPTPNSSISVGGYADFSSSSSTSNSNSQAQTYAQEVTERAMERIVTKTQTKRTSRILKEFEENNKHGFDNTKGTDHVTGVYRWVDKIYKNKLINYGKRLMYEFAIPEPARFLKEAIWKNVEDNNFVSGVILPQAPIHPKDYVFASDSNLRIKNAGSLNLENYQEIASQYNAQVNAIEISKTISDAFSTEGYAGQGNAGASSFKMEIPEGYAATQTKFYGGFVFVPHALEYTYATISVENNSMGFGGANWNAVSELLPLDNIKNELSISFIGADVGGICANVVAYCSLTEEALQQWQNETYNAIMDAYNERLREYNEATIANEVIPGADKEKLTYNPLHNRSLEKKELKRVAIELLIDQERVSKDNYTSGTVDKVTKNEAFEAHAATVKFFEQAFDWEIMAYTFYPYMYGKQEDWKELFQEQDAADPLFQAFLQSGMARTVVPIRPGFEDAVNWYMTTGEIWNGQGLVVDQDDDLYVSIAEEMQTVEGEVEGTWETRLPTSLTVLQAGSIGLKVEGLPCNTDCEDFKLFDSDGEEILDDNGESFSNPIEQTNTLIGGAEPVTTEPVAAK